MMVDTPPINGGAKDLCDDYEFDLDAYPAAAEFMAFVRDDIVRQVVSLGKKQSDLFVPFTERILRTMGGFDECAFEKMFRNEMVLRTVTGPGVENNLVCLPPSTEGDVFVARTALVRCGTFVDVCELQSGVTHQYPMVALVLDYDVRMVNGRRMRKNHPRSQPNPLKVKIQMFSEKETERCLMSAMLAKLNGDTVSLVVHNPHIVSVMYDSKKYPDGMRVRDLLGRYPDHGETMEALDTMPEDFNTWAYPASVPLTPGGDIVMDFLENELDFEEDDHRFVAQWVVYAMLQLEKGVTDSVAIITESMFNDLWACTNNVECATEALEVMTRRCDRMRAVAMFNAGRYTNGCVIINPLSYNPRRGAMEPCWVGPTSVIMENMRDFFGRRLSPLHITNMGLEGDHVRHYGGFMYTLILSPDGSVDDKLRTLKAPVRPSVDDDEDNNAVQEPERAVAIRKSRCAVCLLSMDTAGPHRPCALPCGHIFGYRCAVRLPKCGLCNAVVGHPSNLRPLYLNCFEYTEEMPNADIDDNDDDSHNMITE